MTPPSCLLPYRPPYHWEAMLDFLAARAVPATEQVTPMAWHRSLRALRSGGGAAGATGATGDLVAGTVTVIHEPQRPALRVDLSPGLAGAEADVLARVGRMFDVACDPQAVCAVLGDLGAADPGLRLPGTVDPFETAVRAILGQQVTVAAARTLAGRLVARFGMPLPAGAPLTHLFPPADRMAGIDAAALGELGIIRARSEAIIAVARALADGALQLQPGAAVAPALAALTAIRGIGPWTAHYVAMRTLGWGDAFPPGDTVVLKALQASTAAEADRLAQAWRPWRAYAVLHLWRRMALSAN